jgi:hypothetical protein
MPFETVYEEDEGSVDLPGDLTTGQESSHASVANFWQVISAIRPHRKIRSLAKRFGRIQELFVEPVLRALLSQVVTKKVEYI